MSPRTHMPSPAYLLIEDFGDHGREAILHPEACSHADVLAALKQSDRPLSVWELWPDEQRMYDVSQDFAQEIASGVINGSDSYPVGGLLDFCEDHLGAQAMAELARQVGGTDI